MLEAGAVIGAAAPAVQLKPRLVQEILPCTIS